MRSGELEELRARAEALEQMLEIYERTVAEQAEKLEKQADALRRSNESLEQYAYVISHDLQEPLRMVSAYSELIAEQYKGKLDANADKYIEFASGGARRMQQLINALLDYSRITFRGKELVPVDLDGVLDDVLHNLSLAIEEGKAVVSREPLHAVLGDRSQLLQLLQNLCGNALKFKKPDQPLHLSIAGAAEGKQLHLRIADDGIGIDPRHHQRIFVLFQRLNPKKFTGTGIGLSVCQKIAERHGGRIWVESSAGKGSTFHVLLQLAAEKPT
jgi:light-regulated signal transduction histidine kinase (bacteriophytochrome)